MINCSYRLLQCFDQQHISHSRTITPFPLADAFCCRQLRKILWQKEKLLIMSNFTFSHNVLILSNSYTYFYSDFSYFILNVFRVVDQLRFFVHEKGLNNLLCHVEKTHMHGNVIYHNETRGSSFPTVWSEQFLLFLQGFSSVSKY